MKPFRNWSLDGAALFSCKALPACTVLLVVDRLFSIEEAHAVFLGNDGTPGCASSSYNSRFCGNVLMRYPDYESTCEWYISDKPVDSFVDVAAEYFKDSALYPSCAIRPTLEYWRMRKECSVFRCQV